MSPENIPVDALSLKLAWLEVNAIGLPAIVALVFLVLVLIAVRLLIWKSG